MSTADCGCPILTGGVLHAPTCYWSMPTPAPTPHACPSCAGQGKVSRPPWVGGDQQEWASNTTGLYDCRACHGTGIVWSKT